MSAAAVRLSSTTLQQEPNVELVLEIHLLPVALDFQIPAGSNIRLRRYRKRISVVEILLIKLPVIRGQHIISVQKLKIFFVRAPRPLENSLAITIVVAQDEFGKIVAY